MTARAHLITGGFPRGSGAGHDMDYARLQLLTLLGEHDITTTVSGDYADVGAWLDGADLLITYVAGPFPDKTQNAMIRTWLENGGRWLGLHGTSGGKAIRVEGGRAMVKSDHHKTLGSFFLNHPPVRRFEVKVATDHPLAHGLPPSFEVADELYLLELQGDVQPLLTTEIDEDPSPPGFGFRYEADTSAQADGRTRTLGYTRVTGRGGVAYIALGHCHSPATNVQPFVDASVDPDGRTPTRFRGPWETPEFRQLLDNAIRWGVHADR